MFIFLKCNELYISSQSQSILFAHHKSHQHSWQLSPASFGGKGCKKPHSQIPGEQRGCKALQSCCKSHCAKEGAPHGTEQDF